MAARHSVASSTLTLKQWAELPEDMEGELIDGRLEAEEVPSHPHELTVAWLVSKLFEWAEPRGGFVVGSEIKYAVASKRGRKPDLSVVLPGRPPLNGTDYLTVVPPDIMVEVITPTPRDIARDRIDKMHEYAHFGVRWYWIVDPSARTLEIFERSPKGDRYVRAAAANAGRRRIPGCRGLTLDLTALWRYAWG